MRAKIYLSCLVALAMSLIAVTSVTAQVVRTVPAGGPFPNIQAAHDDAGTVPGSILTVLGGTYTSAVITKPGLTITGSGVGVTTVVPTVAVGITPGSSSAYGNIVLLVQPGANNTVIQNLTVDGNNPLLAGQVVGAMTIEASGGIVTYNAPGININNVTVRNIYGQGIQVWDDLNALPIATVNLVTIENVRAVAASPTVFGSIGILDYGHAGSFTNITMTDVVNGIATNYGKGMAINSNSITAFAGSNGTGITSANNGGAGGASTADQITNNVISGGANGIRIFQPALNVFVNDNNIMGYTNDGVSVYGQDPCGAFGLANPLITNNEINGLGNLSATGIYLTSENAGGVAPGTGCPVGVVGTQNVTASFNNNTITNNAEAIVLNSAAGRTVSATGHYNALTNNTVNALAVTNGGTVTANLTCNWQGTTDPAVIATKNSTLPTTSYIPYLTSGTDLNPGTASGQRGFTTGEACNTAAPGVCDPNNPDADILSASNPLICNGSNSSVNVDLYVSNPAPFYGVFNIVRTTGGLMTQTYAFTLPTNGTGAVLIPASYLSNNTAANVSYTITWSSLTAGNGCSQTAPDNNLRGQVIITVEPVPSISASSSQTNACNNTPLTITVFNPNGVGGQYNKVVNYGPVTGGTPTATNQNYGPFTETLNNPTGSVQTVTYTFTPVGPGTLGCVGTSTTITVTVQPTPQVVTCPGTQSVSTDPNQCYATVTVPAPTFNPAGGCNGGPVTVTYTVGGATTRTGGGAATGQFNKGVSVVRYTITDPQGNVNTSCTVTITVNDNQAPTWTVCPGPQVRTVPATVTSCQYTAIGSEFDGTVTDNCGVVTRTYTLSGVTTATTTTANTLSGTAFNKGVTTVTWRAYDAVGNNATCTFTVTVNDVTAPVITCPVSGITTRTATAVPSCVYTAQGTEFDATATDNCGVITRTYVLSGATTGSGGGTLAGRVFNLGTTLVTWTAVDAVPNTSTCSFSVAVVDAGAPTITCKPNTVTSTSPGECYYITKNNELDATVTDNCSGPNPAIVPVATYTGATTGTSTGGTLSGTNFNKGVTTIVWKATDAAGNSSTCSFTITVNDTELPVITCTSNKTVPTDPSVCTYTHPAGNLTWNASVTENCGVVVLAYTLSGATTNTLGLSSLENQVFNRGLTTVTYVAKDVSGNVATCTFTVTVFDNVAPALTCQTGTVSRSTDLGVCTWMAGNTGGRNIDVAVVENCAYTVTYTLTGVTTMTAMPGTLSNTQFNRGLTNVSVTVYDGTFTSSCAFAVQVNDFQRPVISTCPGNQTKSTDNNVCTYTAKNTEFDAIATDNCGLVPTNRAYTVTGATTTSGTGTLSGTVFNKGTSTVTWVVTDASGNTNTVACSFTVQVNDNQAPSVTPIPDQTLNTGGPGCQTTMPDYTGFVRTFAFDNCGTATGTLTITQQAPNAPGTTVIGFGGTRVLVFFVVDASGNSTTVSFNLLLRDQTAPTALCKTGVTLFLGAGGTVSVTVADIDNGSFDNCTAVTMTVSPTSFSCANTNTTNTVSLIVRDANGNINTCTTNVSVVDNTKPVITCPGDITLYKNAIACTTVIPDMTGTATATDNCSVVSKVQSPAPGTIIAASVTQTLVTITATDASGNTQTCTLTIFHRDTIKPTFTLCPGNFTVTSNSVSTNGGGNTTTCAQNVTWNASATDNCLSNGPVVITSVPAIGSAFALGTTTVTLTATDAAGNTQTCVFRVTVVDNTKPNITCGGTVTFTTPAGGSSCTATVNVAPPIASDNCTTVTVTSNYAGNQFPIGTTTITWTATDGSGNTNTCTQQVIVSDGSKPQFTCPASITISPNTSGCVASATIAAPTPVTDCSGPVTITYSISGAGASGPVTGTGAVGSRIFNVGTTNITYTATDAAGNTNTCVTSVTVVNNLMGSISGTSTVVQNSGTTTAVVFTGSGGTTPYLFTYTITANGNTNTYTVPTVSSNPSTSVAQSNAVLGVYVYRLISITDFYGCSGVIVPNQNTATVTVVSGPPDFTPTVDIASLSFPTPGATRDFLVNINEISQLSPSLGAVQFRLVKPTAFTITYSTTSGTSNVFGPQANNNSDWTFSEDAFFITVTLKHPTAQIAANSFSRIGFTIARKVGVAPNTSQNLTVTIVNGSGGDNNNNNNTSNTVVTAQ